MCKKGRFLESILSEVRNIPKSTVKVCEYIGDEVDEGVVGLHTTAIEEGLHEIMIREDQFKTFPKLLGVLSHEAMHSGLFDLLNTLVDSGVLSDQIYRNITERSANICEEIVRVIATDFPRMKKEYEKLSKSSGSK